MDSSLSLRPAIQLAGLILSGLFFLNQTRKQGLVLSLLCMVAWLGAVFLALSVIRQQGAQVGGSISISKRVETIDEISLIQLDPIIQTETEQVIVILPNEQVPQAGSWANVPANVARWQPYIMKSIAHCGLVTPGYDPALLIAAIVTQESSGNPNAMGKAHDTGLGQVVNNSHPLFPNRPSREELLDPQFNLNFASCLLKNNLNYTGSVEAAINAYNGNGIHNGRTYAQIIFDHYTSFQEHVPAPPLSPATASGGTFSTFASWPVSGKPIITQAYQANHPGVDIVGSGSILAVMDGTVQYIGPLYKSKNSNAQCAKAGCLGGFSVVLDHGGGTFTIYGHNSCAHVEVGQSVRAGQPIACMGSEGRSTGPHLHFELRTNEKWNGNPNWPWQGSYLSATNPTSYFPK